MLIGVKLPITQKNIVDIDAVQLMEAHDYFLYHTQLSNGNDGIFKKQYEVCRNEIVKRLLELEGK